MNTNYYSRKIAGITVAVILIASVGCHLPNQAPPENNNLKSITILYTNDEHGWMEGTEPGQGAAEMIGVWKDQEGYVADGSFLILSGGDMWTGPAISTWFEGESMAEVMNEMGYDAAAIGNHEFDFKVVATRARSEQSTFPYLSANLRLKSDGTTPDFAQPYIVKDVDGMRVGIIGLTTTSTPYTAFPEFVAEFDFIDYKTALEDVLPSLNAESPDIIIVISHVCASELAGLAEFAQANNINLLAGGHCHATHTSVSNSVGILETGRFLQAYGVAHIMYDPQTKEVMNVTVEVKSNAGGTPDPETVAIVDSWNERLDGDLATVIAYTSQPYEQHSDALHNLIPDAWLWKYPNVAVAAMNYGGYRQGLPAGDITIADIVGILPFLNNLYIIDLPGDRLTELFATKSVVPGGATILDGSLRLSDGSSPDSDSTYSILITDYMYSAFEELKLIDTTPIQTGVNWRDPVVEWLVDKGATVDDPLKNYLDFNPRR